MKSPVYRRGVFVAACLGLLLLPVGCYGIKVTLEPDPSQSELASVDSNLQIQSESAKASTLSTSTKKPAKLFAYHQGSGVGAKGSGQGILRMSNQTDQPVRLALLARATETKSAFGDSKSDIPAHWDFAPGEGSEDGLVLSLPNSQLQVQKGDILVAFAQDGSRRYWGPYIVGESSTPVWNQQKQEWELILDQ